ncbi:MAG: acyltransferase domain-containing protein [Candidatus Poribacteria bacterium]
MNLNTVLNRLGIPDREDVFAEDWESSQRALPVGGIPFLMPDYVTWACEAAYLPRGMTQAVLAVSKRIAADEALCAFAWYCHHRLFQARERRVEIHRLPILTAALGRDAGMFYVLILLAFTPQMQEVHHRRKIPADIVRDTVLNLKFCMEAEDYSQEFGQWGISPRILNWLMNHWRGELYRLGRLQFVPSRFHGKLRAFRHRAKGTVIALSEEGARYRSDGQVDGAGGVYDAADAWTATLNITDTEIIGYPIAPVGHAIRNQVRLPTAEWAQVLAPGHPVLAIHIPAGSPMSFELCGESVRQALEFFPKHFPDKPFIAFTCHSWILDRQFEKLLPPTSNLVRFQKEMYLFPVAGGNESVLRAVFGRKTKDISSAPRDTTMQRAFARHIETGGHFRGGGCFLLKDDLNWGSQFYRRQSLPWQD